MLVHRPRLKTQGAVVTTVAMLALGACDDPTARTDLRPEGPPDVLAVLVLNDAVGGLVESAAYCKPNDEKRPGLVGLPDFTTQQICPEDLSKDADPLTNAAPELWYVRIMFDELLDGNVEDLIPVLDENEQETDVYTGTLRNTQPVILQCRDANNVLVNIDYDGYYSPSGNAVTWPLGPSLVVKPLDPTTVPVESECQITLKDTIRDKAGNAPDKLGPFTFRMAPVEIIGISPGGRVPAEVGGVELAFNVEVDASSTIPFTFTPAVTRTGIEIGGSSAFVSGDLIDGTEYAFEIPEGTKVKDKCGKESTLVGELATEFETLPAALVNITPFQGPNALPSRKIQINFNQFVDPASIDTSVPSTDYEWVGEAPENFSFGAGADPSIIVLRGLYKINTNYKFRLKAGATIRTCPGGAPPCAPEAPVITLAAEQLIDITTVMSISNTAVSVGAGSTSPSRSVTITGTGGQTIRKISDAENVFVRFTFNQDMDGTSLAMNEFSLARSDGTPITPPAAGTGAGTTATLNFGALPAGTYKFTLNDGATVNDLTSVPGVFTQAGKREFTFNVVVQPPAPSTPFSCITAP